MKFVRAVSSYIYSRVTLISKLPFKLLTFSVSSEGFLKDWLIRKLLWSRGRLGKPVLNLVIFTVALFLFLVGGVFSSTGFVNSQEINPDYFAKPDDFISDAVIATTSLPEGRREDVIVHEVSRGESLSSIGALYKISVDALKYVNNLTDEDYLKVGQKLMIPPVQGVIYKVKSGDTCESIGKKYEVAAQAILDFNYLDSCSSLAVGKELVVPDAKIPEPIRITPSFPTPNYRNFVDVNPRSGWCIWPTSVRIITQYFSYYHNGLDIATPWGQMPPIYACGEGKVVRSGWDPWGLGLHIIIDHGNGYSTVYGHMSKLLVSVGAEVSKGEVIGIMGSTGRSTGPHIHFIVKYKGTSQNPLKYIR